MAAPTLTERERATLSQAAAILDTLGAKAAEEGRQQGHHAPEGPTARRLARVANQSATFLNAILQHVETAP